MSLSQKHSGKVFVPWYNTSEWRKVYDMLCTENEKNYDQALSILKIWKYRTPLLSAGVEGTLIILEAILIKKENLSDTQLTQIFALALMRFLNICAAHNDKQGTFHKTVTKNDLPKWLINIRHDIAHDHKLPSKSVLELGLNSCLEWVKGKYWEIQKEIISDCVVTEDSTNAKILELLKIYIRLKLNIFSQKNITEYDEGLMGRINELILKKYHTEGTDLEGMIRILEESLKQLLSEPSYKNIGEKVSKLLVNSNVLLSSSIEVTSGGQEIIPRSFRDLWSNLLNILYENGFLFSLLNELLEVTNNIMFDDGIRRAASLWINEIFQGLQKIRMVKEEIDSIAMNNADELDPRTSTIVLKSVIEKKCPEYKGCLEFHSPQCLPFASAEVFQEKVLNLPNNYTLNFLERVLQFNKNTDSYINDTINLVKKLIWTTVNITDEEMYTAEHLEEIFNIGLNMEWSEPDGTTSNGVPTNSLPNGNTQTDDLLNDTHPTNKWTLLKDTSPYKGCPLGILPDQNRNRNPLFSY